MNRLLCVLAFLLAVPCTAQEIDSESLGVRRFELFSECRPMDLTVEALGSPAQEIGLTVDRLQTTVESRLRSARLYRDKTLDFSRIEELQTQIRENLRSGNLYLNVNVQGRAFAVLLEYMKFIHDPVSGEDGTATTWRVGSVGTHGRDASFILSIISEYVDRFLVEYLQVNEDACE